MTTLSAGPCSPMCRPRFRLRNSQSTNATCEPWTRAALAPLLKWTGPSRPSKTQLRKTTLRAVRGMRNMNAPRPPVPAQPKVPFSMTVLDPIETGARIAGGGFAASDAPVTSRSLRATARRPSGSVTVSSTVYCPAS